MNSKSTKLFEIENFDLQDETIEVDICKANTQKTISVPRDRFEKWLKYDDRLEYEYNYSDHTGSHQQQSGSMSLDEYWQSDSKAIEHDLYEFIVLKMMDLRKMFTSTFTDLQAIASNFFSHVKTA